MLISASDIIRRTVAIYRDNWRLCLTYMGIIAVPYFLSAIVEILLLPENPEELIAGPSQAFFIWVAIAGIVFTVIELWISVAFTRALAARYLGQAAPDPKAELSSAVAKILPLLWVVVLTVLAIFGGFILFIIPAFIFGVWFTFGTHAVMLDDKKGVGAMKFSKGLVTGRWGSVFWRLIAPGLAFGILMVLLQSTVGYVYGMLLGETIMTGTSSYQYNINLYGLTLVSTLISLFFFPIFTAYPTILYLELKKTPQTPETPPTQS